MSPAAFNWSEYLNLADNLSAKLDEASHRTSVSRAYYFVYHTASATAVANGYVDMKSHVALWNYFNKQSDRQCRKIAQIGLRMKRNRVRADYEATFAKISALVPIVLADAKGFLTQINAIPSGFPTP